MYPELSPTALEVLRKRYFFKDKDGNLIEDTADTFFTRVVDGVTGIEHPDKRGWVANVAELDRLDDDMYDMLRNLRFLPNSPCLMNAGKPYGKNQLAACFVLPIEDDLRSIKQADFDSAIIHQSGGGTGFNFSKIRPRGSYVRSSGGIASGPVSFMSMIDYSCGQIKQGGTRRGANMGILNVDHPDIEEFIACKNEDGRISNFNISVGLTDKFIAALKCNDLFELINPQDGSVAREVHACSIWDSIVESAWLNGEPGIIFLDRIKDTNPTPQVGEQDTTNPCGEQPLLPYEACVLGSLNLSSYVTGFDIDWDLLRSDVRLAVRFLDDMIESSYFPIDKITDMVKNGNRRIGLGVMGWADLLFKLEIPYDSDHALYLAEDIMAGINAEAKLASQDLAKVLGSYPNWVGSAEWSVGNQMRNATRTTIAPTGTISMIADCSAGIEPAFALVYQKNVMRDDNNKATSFLYVDKTFEAYAKRHDFYSEKLMKAVASNRGSLKYSTDTPEWVKKVFEEHQITDEVRDIFSTAHDIKPHDHIEMQARFQMHTENAVSKTINLPHEATKTDVENAYMFAFNMRCKGVTVYRDGSRKLQVLTAPVQQENPHDGICSDCGDTLVYSEGCLHCKSCGFSACAIS